MRVLVARRHGIASAPWQCFWMGNIRLCIGGVRQTPRGSNARTETLRAMIGFTANRQWRIPPVAQALANCRVHGSSTELGSRVAQTPISYGFDHWGSLDSGSDVYTCPV